MPERVFSYHEPDAGCRWLSSIDDGSAAAMEATTSTFTLLEKAKAGDEAAALAGIRAVSATPRPSWCISSSATRSRERTEVDDVVQETYLRAFRDVNRFTYQTPGSFLRWLSSIADHVIVDQVRYRHRDRRAGEEVPFRSQSNPLGPEPADTRTPSRLLGQQEAVERLLARLNELPEDYRQAILLAKIQRASRPPKWPSGSASLANRWPCWSIGR
jgi:RNA polymerase sigma factor (sigma-70 family)